MVAAEVGAYDLARCAAFGPTTLAIGQTTGGVVSHEPGAAQRAMLTFVTVLAFALGVHAPAAAADLTLDSAVGNPARSAKFVARDKARHPLEELTFFGVTPESTVVEIWPGGGYWTEILAPLLHDHGRYYVALQGKEGANPPTLKRTSSTLLQRQDRGRSRDIRQAYADYFWRWPGRNRPARFGRFDPLLSQPS